MAKQTGAYVFFEDKSVDARFCMIKYLTGYISTDDTRVSGIWIYALEEPFFVIFFYGFDGFKHHERNVFIKYKTKTKKMN